jgi:hypothetical protein
MEVNGNGLGKVRGRGRLLAHGFFMLNSCRCKGNCAIRRLTQTYNVFCWNNQIRSSQSQKNNNNNPRSLQRMRNATQKCNQNLLRVLCVNVVIGLQDSGSVCSLSCTSIISETVKYIRLQDFMMRYQGVWYNTVLKREA